MPKKTVNRNKNANRMLVHSSDLVPLTANQQITEIKIKNLRKAFLVLAADGAVHFPERLH